MDKVIHFEITIEDFERAMKFYNSVFNWEILKVPEFDYAIVHTIEIDKQTQMPLEKGVINGGMMKRNEKIQNPVITINVTNINESIEKLKSAGGEIIMEPFKVGDMGISAYFKDSEGNVLGLWEILKK